MEQARLDEIKARCDRAKRDEYPEKIYGSAAYYLITSDIPELIEQHEVDQAEAERLTTENTGLRANSMIQEHIISSGSDPIRDDKIIKLIMENTTLKQAYDTNAEVHQKLTEDYVALKSERDVAVRALVFACVNACGGVGLDMMGCPPHSESCKQCNNKVKCWTDYFIQQAKEDLKK